MAQQHITTRIPDDMYEEIEQIKKEENKDRSATVKDLLEKGIKEWKIETATKNINRKRYHLEKQEKSLE